MTAANLLRIAGRRLPALVVGAALVFGFGAYAAASARPVHGATKHRRHHRPRRPKLILIISPTRDTILAGSTAGYRIRVKRIRFKGRVKIRVLTGLPTGASARFAPRSITGASTVLDIATSSGTPPGDYRLQLRASRGKVRSIARIMLTVGGSAGGAGSATQALPSYGIAGDVSNPLWPGQPQGIDLAVSNPNTVPLDITDLTVTISGINAPGATTSLPCSTADFTVQQYSYSYPLVVPPSTTTTLEELKVPASNWPQVELLNLPSDQDGCQGASLSLTYGGQAGLG